MKLPTEILVATDFGETAGHAFDYAVLLAEKLDARIHVVHAISVPELGVPELGVALASTMSDTLVRQGQTSLDELVARAGARVPFGDVALRSGDPRDVVLQVAQSCAADLIVMGTHGRRGVLRTLLGSVAESVVRGAVCPVLTVSAKVPQP